MDPVTALSESGQDEESAASAAAWLNRPEKTVHRQTLAERWAAEPEWKGGEHDSEDESKRDDGGRSAETVVL
jgi:hypothetical protein